MEKSLCQKGENSKFGAKCALKSESKFSVNPYVQLSSTNPIFLLNWRFKLYTKNKARWECTPLLLTEYLTCTAENVTYNERNGEKLIYLTFIMLSSSLECVLVQTISIIEND